MDKDNRNTVILMVCAMVMLFAYQTFVIAPHERARQQAAAAVAAQQAKLHPVAAATTSTPARAAPDAKAIPSSQRVSIDTPKLGGSIALVGARFDDLYLKAYHKTPDPKSDLIRLMRPADADHPWLAEMQWESPNAAAKTPGADTLWTVAPGAVLTPTNPLMLTYDNGQGLVFHRTIAVDSNYMFAVADSVTNTGGQPVSLNAYDVIVQNGLPADPSVGIPNGGSVPVYSSVNVGVQQELQLSQRTKLRARLDIVNVSDNVYELRDGSGVGVNAPQYGQRRGFYGTLSFLF